MLFATALEPRPSATTPQPLALTQAQQLLVQRLWALKPRSVARIRRPLAEMPMREVLSRQRLAAHLRPTAHTPLHLAPVLKPTPVLL